MIKSVTIVCLLVLNTMSVASDDVDPIPAPFFILPLVLQAESCETLADLVGDEIWVSVEYRADPHGQALFFEPSEKVWWIQDRALVILGASGYPFPESVATRTTAYIQLACHSWDIQSKVIEIFPRRDLIQVSENAVEMTNLLSKRMAGVDAGYLSQVANYLAGNAATLDVMGSSYSVDSVGTVIDSDGTWVGACLEPTTPGGSVFLGIAAGRYDDGTNNYNTYVGYSTGIGTEDGSWNTAMGLNALQSNVSGEKNAAIGSLALQYCASSYNVAVGSNALYNCQSGIRNTGIGYHAGPPLAGSALSNTTSLGNWAAATSMNEVRIGDTNVTKIGGQVAWSTASDGRFKVGVQDYELGLDFILDLRPVSYRMNRSAMNRYLGIEEDDSSKSHSLSDVTTGFIAQEVENALEKRGLVFSGLDAPPNDRTPYSLRYSQFVVPLVKAIQEQQATIESQADELRALRQWAEENGYQATESTH